MLRCLLLLALSYSACLGFAPSRGFTKNRVTRKSSLSMSVSTLIVQNKGGGHGELGYQLAKNLSSNPEISSVTILQDAACNDESEPFKSYASDLPKVKVVKATMSDDMSVEKLDSILGGAKFDCVWDNCSKGPVGAGKAICDAAKELWGTKVFTYVSSAGMYEPAENAKFPMEETTPIKESSGQAQYDKYAVEIGLPLVSFRPQYIYGPKSNKYDYIDWFFDRLTRDQPLPIPGDGNQKVSLTNSVDVASLLASVLNNPEAAIDQRFFNCGTDELVTYNDVAKLCAEAAGISNYEIQHYDAALGKAKFPFRLTDFYVDPQMAKSKLNWEGPKHSLKDDLKQWYYDGYQARTSGKDMDFSADQEVLVQPAQSKVDG